VTRQAGPGSACHGITKQPRGLDFDQDGYTWTFSSGTSSPRVSCSATKATGHFEEVGQKAGPRAYRIYQREWPGATMITTDSPTCTYRTSANALSCTTTIADGTFTEVADLSSAWTNPSTAFRCLVYGLPTMTGWEDLFVSGYHVQSVERLSAPRLIWDEDLKGETFKV